MYIDNTKKLFEDLHKIPTMESYMWDCVRADGQQDDLSNLVSIVWNYHDALCNSDEMFMGEALSSMWDLAEYDEKGKKQLIADNRALNNIWKIIKKELKALYVLKCRNCGGIFFYGKKPLYNIKEYKCVCKKIGTLELTTFEKWATPEIKRLREQYIKGY